MEEVVSAIPLINEKTLERLEQGEILRKNSLGASDLSANDLLEGINKIFKKYSIS